MLTAITIGGGVMGIGGMLVAVPLFATFYRLIKEDIARRNPVVSDGASGETVSEAPESEGARPESTESEVATSEESE